jgi:hypothetical protein
MHYLQQVKLALLIAVAIGSSAMPTLGVPNPSAKPQPAPSRSAQPSPNNWQSFRSAAGRFSVQLPEQPVVNSEKAGTPQATYFFRVAQPESFYGISYLDASTTEETKTFLKDMPQELVKAIEGKMTKEQDISLQKNPGKAFDFTTGQPGAKAKGSGRIYAVGKRVYLLFGVGKDQELKQFLNSFNLIY